MPFIAESFEGITARKGSKGLCSLVIPEHMSLEAQLASGYREAGLLPVPIALGLLMMQCRSTLE